MTVPRDPGTVTFTVKGQVVIPRRLRKLYDIEEGTKALVIETEDGILLKPMTAATIRKARGLLKRPNGPRLVDEWAEHKREEREIETKKEERHGRARAR